MQVAAQSSHRPANFPARPQSEACAPSSGEITSGSSGSMSEQSAEHTRQGGRARWEEVGSGRGKATHLLTNAKGKYCHPARPVPCRVQQLLVPHELIKGRFPLQTGSAHFLCTETARGLAGTDTHFAMKSQRTGPVVNINRRYGKLGWGWGGGSLG